MKIPGNPSITRLIGVVCAGAILAASAALVYPAARANRIHAAKEKEPGHAVAQSTTSNDQTDLNVTVYNSNIALIRDVRNLTLPAGTFRLKFMDIAATVNPATVHFRSLTDPEKLGVIEQNYEYDLLEPAKLLHKYVGKEVTLVRSYQESGTTKHEEIKATLLSDNNGPVWKIGNDIVTGGYAESYRFPEVPANLFDRPTLLMSLENSGSRKQQIEASYLAGNLSWNSDYVLTVGREDKTADLDGWVTLSISGRRANSTGWFSTNSRTRHNPDSESPWPPGMSAAITRIPRGISSLSVKTAFITRRRMRRSISTSATRLT